MPLVKRIAENGKIYAKLSDIEPWEKNPRVHDDDAIFRRKKQIARLGQFREVFVNPDGKALGGNRTLKALKSLNENTFVWTDEKGAEHVVDRRGQFDEIKITELAIGEKDGKYFAIIDGQPEETLFDSIEQIFVEYNISDNDDGEWDKKALYSLVQPYQKLIPMGTYKLSIAPSVSLKTFVQKQAIEESKDEEPKSKKVVLKVEFTPDQYEQFKEKLMKVKQAYGAENITDLFTSLVDEAEVFMNEKKLQVATT